MSRSSVKHEWAEMLTRGVIPVMEIDDPRGWVVVDVQLHAKGVWFTWDWDVEVVRPRFDGAIRKFCDGWLVSFAEIDRMGVQPGRCAPTDLRQRHRRGCERLTSCLHEKPASCGLCCF